MNDIFGNVHLGYVVIETRKFADWRRFGVDAVGMHLDSLDHGTMRFRLDDHQCRFLLKHGPAEDATAIGWHIDDHEAFEQILARVVDRGVPVAEGSPEEAAQRGVERLWRFPGPKGLTQEIFTTPLLTDNPVEGFVTGEGGLGHIAVTTMEPHKVRGYYNTVFDARLTDYVDETISGVKLKIRFLRVNSRHHSVAVAATAGLKLNPIRTRIQHLNIQVAGLDDMTQAYQRVRELGFGMALSVGQHTNDRELSFYARSPSGFEWEVGWNPIAVDESTWEPATHQGISLWGHTLVGQTIIDRLAQFRQAARSLREREETVPALSGAGIPDD